LKFNSRFFALLGRRTGHKDTVTEWIFPATRGINDDEFTRRAFPSVAPYCTLLLSNQVVQPLEVRCNIYIPPSSWRSPKTYPTLTDPRSVTLLPAFLVPTSSKPITSLDVSPNGRLEWFDPAPRRPVVKLIKVETSRSRFSIRAYCPRCLDVPLQIRRHYGERGKSSSLSINVMGRAQPMPPQTPRMRLASWISFCMMVTRLA
jgi:hypothetical protein